MTPHLHESFASPSIRTLYKHVDHRSAKILPARTIKNKVYSETRVE